ncbi:MAG: DUF2213 domain-containing protein [Methanobrevibacter sp.]|nr:DUF2213 domain-containing protein [Methanobrevibacter sp.]
MLKLSEKQTLTVHNKMELGEDISVEAKGKGRKFVSRFIEPGVAHYEEFGDVLITKETLDRFINTMVGCPVIIQHKDIDDENVDKERVGVISNVWFNEFDGWYYCDGIIWDKQAIDLIKNQDWSVSCTYDFDSDKLEKTHNGKKIDMEFTGGEFLHLALVPNPRYERANIVMNAKEKDDDVEWITVHGNHIPIKKGQSKDEAVKEFIEKQQGESFDKKEIKISKGDNVYLKSQDGPNKRIGKIIKQINEDVVEVEFPEKGNMPARTDRYYIDELNKEETKTEDKKIEPTQPSKPAYNPPQRKEQNPEPGKKKLDPDEFERIYRKKIEKQHNDASKAFDQLADIFIKEDDSGITDKNIKKRYYKDALDNKNIKDISMTIEDYGYWEKEYNSYKGRYIYKQPEGWAQDLKSKIAQFKRDYPKLADKIEYSVSTEHPDINIHLFWRDDKRAEKETKKKLEKASNSTTVKEITMSVLNELESFIKGVIKNADDEDKKEEVKNEDKRKLIDEVGGILKGKVDDEIIKTIMKKMEEASYEPSEDKKADNEVDEEEKEEKFEEEKKIANKCKNEEEKDKEDKVEDEDDEKDEDDEVDKEEVKNKCKNSMKDVKEIIMGGKSKIESDYISKADRFALGEKY